MNYRIWHVPQVPGKAFHVYIKSIEEAVKILNVLANYDLFQLKNNIKPDFANLQGFEKWDSDAKTWVCWNDEETGEDDPRKYLESIK